MAYVGSAKASSLGATSQVVSYTPGNGNSLILSVYVEYNDVTVTWPSGFTEIVTAKTETLNNGQRAYLHVAQNQNSSSAVTSYTPSFNITTDPCVIIAEFSGRSATLTTNVHGESTQTASGASPITNPLTGLTALVGDDLLWFGCVSDETSGGTWVTTAPTGYTSRQDCGVQTTGEYAFFNLSSKDAVSAGATGTLSGTHTNAGHTCDCTGAVVALTAASGGALRRRSMSGGFENLQGGMIG